MTIYQKIIDIIEPCQKVQLFYLFGSRAAKAEVSPGADWDFACYFDKELSVVEAQFLGFELQAKLSSFLKTDAVDFVVMNGIKSIELAHAIIADGECLVDRHFDRDSFERHIQHEYQDHKMALHRNGFKE